MPRRHTYICERCFESVTLTDSERKARIDEQTRTSRKFNFVRIYCDPCADKHERVQAERMAKKRAAERANVKRPL